MNLADIRKKAQLEKQAQQGNGTPSITVEAVEEKLNPCMTEPEPEDETPAVPVAEDSVADGTQLPDSESEMLISHLDEPEPEEPYVTAAVERRVEDPGSVGPAFDPMAMILAGRLEASAGESAGYEAAPVTRESGDFQEFLCFRVSTEKYAINILDIKEIIKPREITEVPRVPSFISGVLSLRGIIIPVFNMRVRLGLPSVTGLTKERILVIKKNEELCGLMVDEVVQVVRISRSTIEQPPAVLDAIDREFVSGIGRYEGMMLILLNLENILDIGLC